MTQVMEAIDLDMSLIFDAFKFYSNGPKLRKVVGQIHNVTVTRDRPYYYFRNNFTQPSVKRSQSFMFCGVVFNVPKENTNRQILEAAVCTDSKSSLLFRGATAFQEWNTSWDQAEN